MTLECFHLYQGILIHSVPRHSHSFKAQFKTRTSVERSNKRMFEDYAMKKYKPRSAMMRMSLATFAVINIHLDSWVKHLYFSFNALMEKQAA
jgi:hypothetical protein